jgi:hypothetical protein
MRKATLFLLLGSFVGVAAMAQITVGVMPANLNSSDANFPTPQTDVSLENPASGSGTIDTVTFGWNQTCNAVAKIKFFRRSGNNLTQIDERGPFSTFAGGRVTQVVALNPPVNVQTGDLIGITRVASCGNALAEAGTGTQGYVVLSGDATSGTISGGNTFHDKLGLQGTGAAPGNVVAGYIPVVGSTAGSAGAFFRTSMQLFNPSTTSTISGKLIFHKAGASGTLSDPSLSFAVGPNEILTLPDAVAAMSQSGVGSMDIAMAAGAQLPVIVSRIFNDAGTLGTAGVFEEVVTPATGIGTRILTTGTQGFIITPVEPSRTRMNIGVRSLSSGMTFNATLEDSTGHVLQGTTKTYLPDWFEQVDSTSFFGVPIGASQKIRITVTSGNGIVYGATTDNVTNDPSVQFATAFPGS